MKKTNNTVFAIYRFKDLYPNMSKKTIENILYCADNILLKNNKHSYNINYILDRWNSKTYSNKSIVNDILTHAYLLNKKYKRSLPWYEKLLNFLFGDDDIIHINYILEHWDDI